MSTTPESAQSLQALNEQHLMIPEAVMREIAQELGTAKINHISVANSLRRLQASIAAQAQAEPME